ncbi:MAG: TonB-dependent receptor [Ignavibacteriaceae bacterium]|nr:TonB-dependent receptor [Ignavibacteriaceae bacterium]
MKLIFYFLFALLISIEIFPQSLKGTVYELDAKGLKTPLPGTNIYWEGTTSGTTTDAEGFFELKKPVVDSLVLSVSYVGYKPSRIRIADEDSIEIILSVNRELNEVVVTGSSLSKYIDDVDAKQTEIITTKELLKAACCNLSESFTTNASVDVQYQDALTGAKQIQLLGLSGLYTQILFENIPILKGLGSSFGLSHVPGPWMTSISISKGAASVINGYESVTGQINIDYKKPDDLERYYFNIFQSSHFKTDLNANAAFQLNENLSSIVLAHSNFNKKVMDENQDSFRDQPNTVQYNILNRWHYQALDGFESQFGFQILNEERRGGTISESHNHTPGEEKHPYLINIDTKKYQLFTKTGYVFDEEGYSSLGLILNFQKQTQNSEIGLRNYSGDQNTLYANLLFEESTEDEVHSITMGGSFVYDKYDESFENEKFARQESRPGLFAEYSFSPDNLITLVPGLRIDFHNLYGTFFTPRLHGKIRLDENTTIRFSAGKGYRSVNVFSENLSYLASSRNFVIINSPSYEEAWNYGLNITKYIRINERDLRITADYYRTDFLKQTVIDIDSDVREVKFYDLKGKSFSNNYQIEVTYQPIDRLDVTATLRYSDVKTDYNGKLLSKPLSSRYKGLFTFSYSTGLNGWLFDATVLLNGSGRIPSTSQNPPEYRRAENFPSHTIINAQITKRIDLVDVYIGAENLTNFKQKNPIISGGDPYSEYFDASMIWGPIDGTKLYIGLRLSLI